MAGCGKKAADYTPAVATAEDAVRRGLEAWKQGQPAGEVAGSKPAIHIVDVGRKPGQTLEGYRILGETSGSSGRTIAVSLQLANPAEQVKTRYIVVGIDPLWVFRQEDYELLMHWDHKMPAPEAEPATSDDGPSPQANDAGASLEAAATAESAVQP